MMRVVNGSIGQRQPGDDPEALTSMHVRRAITGEEDSLTWVVRRLSPLLLAQADYRLGPRLRSVYDAEDLVNEVWMVALPRLRELPARDDRYTPVVLRFLSSTLLHRIKNIVRKHAKADGQNMPVSDHLLDRAPDAHTGVVSQAVRAERRDAVMRAIEALDPKDREVLLMRGIEQQANKTVAMLLKMKEQTVAMRYLRALEKLRAKLPGSVFEELPG